MAEQEYVALDLELIEPNSPRSRVIEIAAVRFTERAVLEEWSTLVNPSASLPYTIRQLTGIDDRELTAAPSLDSIAERLRAFVGRTSIVGQSVEIDVAHLARQGIALDAPILDTFELASLLLPGLPSYELTAIARALGLPSGGAHRALADAHRAREVFLALLDRIRSLDIEILMHIDRLTLGFDWAYRDLFVEAGRERRRQLVSSALSGDILNPVDLGLSRLLAPPTTREEPLTPHARRRRVDPEVLAAEMSAGGRVARTLAGYEERPEQLAMLRAVAHAFNEEKHLITEAGTGTGKSLAYLLPALAYASANNDRVVVSTNTINLQDQLSEKDAPGLLSAMDYRARVAVLKGRANYLCLQRWLSLLRSEAVSRVEAGLLVKTLLWITQTETGDRGELRLTPDEEVAWGRICSQSESCSSLTCRYHRDGVCFISRARRAAEASHVVIVNHALLLSDLTTNSRVVPDHTRLVIDEAHHLEDEATRQLGFSIYPRTCSAPLEALIPASGRDGVGHLDAAMALLRSGGLAPKRLQQLDEATTDIRAHAVAALGFVSQLFEATRDFLTSAGSQWEPVRTIRLTPVSRRGNGWDAIEVACDGLCAHFDAIEVALEPILEDLSDAAKEGSQAVSDVLAELLAIRSQMDAVVPQLRAIVTRPAPDTVCWLTQPQAQGGTDSGGAQSAGPPSLNLAPLDVAPQLRAAFLDSKSTTIFTSATLTTEGSFEFIRERLGAAEVEELALGSPFDYQRAAMLIVPDDVPEPNQPGYARKCADVVADVAEALGGKTMALFTSHAQLRTTHDAIRDRIDRAQIALMGQGVDGSRTRLLQRFKATERALLLGTASFWEGVDVVGEALSALIIARLPFAVPTDPVFAARSELFDDPFRQFALPHAILRFKQGFGRLIRSATDRGVVVVLDRRVLSKSYGQAFLSSLPTCTIRRAPAGAAGTLAREWLENAPAP
ncbi:MAG TPA: helicase C-terminal domain-containing protein [Chloroflexota bacterium]|nr:helicase C-terminal domain-containing protein [Chloroflexota bacterium]